MSDNKAASHQPTKRSRPDSQGLIFDELVDEISEKLQNGEDVSVDDLAELDPEMKERIEQLMPTLKMMAFLDSTDSNGVTDRGGFDSIAPNPHGAIPRELGDYCIIRQLGKGGMGVVYEAEQITLGRRVALKLLMFAGLFDETGIKRFKNEARAAAMLKHPNIVSVYGIGTERGIHYYAMELVDGQSIAEVIALLHATQEENDASLDSHTVKPSNGSSDTCPQAMLSTIQTGDRRTFYRSVAKLGVQAARALEYAHGQGIIHRDIKPSNLLVDNLGHLFVADFGLARLQSDSDLTQTGELVGTLRYMSPERVESGAPIDHRADVYGLGATLYEMLVNRHVVEGDDANQMLRNLIERQPAKLSSIDKQIPLDLCTVIHKSLEKEPSDRYRTAAEFADDLQRVIDNRTIKARKVRSYERAVRWAKRNKVVATSLAAIMILLATLAVVGFVAAGNAEKSKRQLLESNYSSDILVASAAGAQGDALQAERILLRWMPEKQEGRDLRNFEWFHLWNRIHDPAVVQTVRYRFQLFHANYINHDSQLLTGCWASDTTDLWDVRAPFVEPIHRFDNRSFASHCALVLEDSSSFIVGADDGCVTIYDSQTFEEIDRFDIDLPIDRDRVESLSASDDARYVAACTGYPTVGGLHVWDRHASQWKLQRELASKPRTLWLGNDILVTADANSGVLSQWDMRDSVPNPKPMHDTETGGVDLIHRLGDDAIICVTRFDSGDFQLPQVEVWDVHDWTRRFRRSIGDTELTAVAVSDNKQQIAVGNSQGTVFLLSATSGHVQAVSQHHSRAITSLTYSDADSRLTSTSRDSNLRICDVKSLIDGSQSIQSTGIVGLSARLLDDERMVFALANEIVLYDLNSKAIVKTIDCPMEDNLPIYLTLSPDQKSAALARGHFPPQDRTAHVELFDLESCTKRKTIEIPAGIMHCIPNFSPDSKNVAICANDGLHVIDVNSGETIHRVAAKRADGWSYKHLRFSPDGKLFAASTTVGWVHVFSTSTFEPLVKFQAEPDYAGDLCFSPDGRDLAVTGFDNKIKIFDPATGKQRPIEFEATNTYHTSIAYTHDGKRLLTTSLNDTPKLWNAATGDLALEIDVPTAHYALGDISPSGKTFLVSSGAPIQVIRSSLGDDLKRLSLAQLIEVSCNNFLMKKDWRPKWGSKKK